jgi:hypothetical protein
VRHPPSLFSPPHEISARFLSRICSDLLAMVDAAA